MHCPKKVAFEYIGVNARFRNMFAKREQELQELVDGAKEELNEFVAKNMSGTAKSKTEVMANTAKKEAEEKKAKKAKEKYGVDIVEGGGNKQKEEDSDDEGQGQDEGNVEPGEHLAVANNEFKKVGLSNEKKTPWQNASSTSSTASVTDARPSFIDTNSSSSLHAAPLTPTPKGKDIPRIHKTLVGFSRAGLFGVYNNGNFVPSEVILDDNNKIQVNLSI